MKRNADWFPVDRWLNDMQSTVDQIIEQGRLMLDAHRASSDAAAKKADFWQLDQRHDHSRAQMLKMIAAVREIIESVDECRHRVNEHPAGDQSVQASMIRCADTIDQQLPGVEDSLIEIRHSALDLLQWTQRAGRMEESGFQQSYRASFAGLIAHGPIFKPMMDAFLNDLIQINPSAEIQPDTQRLVSATNRYNAVIESARGFIGSVVEPPLELTFHETEAFDSDSASLSSESLANLATQVNDCCQLLLYDPGEFKRRVQPIRPRIADGVDASMVVLTLDGTHSLVFTVDEDPLFKQLVVTLLRVIPVDQLDRVTQELTHALYKSFSPEA